MWDLICKLVSEAMGQAWNHSEVKDHIGRSDPDFVFDRVDTEPEVLEVINLLYTAADRDPVTEEVRFHVTEGDAVKITNVINTRELIVVRMR
jgi:hypothetical protein